MILLDVASFSQGWLLLEVKVLQIPTNYQMALVEAGILGQLFTAALCL